jgi:hypothetical protein
MEKIGGVRIGTMRRETGARENVVFQIKKSDAYLPD